MPRPAKETRENFEAGRVDAWSAGEYGHRVRVFAEAGKLKVRFQDPATGRTKQRTVFRADSDALRREATGAAVKIAERLRAGRVAEEEAADAPATVADLTMEDVAHLFMKRAGAFPRELLTGSYSDVREWYNALPERVRALDTVPALSTIVRDVYGWRHLFADDRFRPDRRVIDIDPADATNWAQDVVADETYSPRTAANDLDRLSSAFNHVRTQHRSIGLTYNPIEGRKVDRERADVDAYTQKEGAKLWAAAPALADEGRWQVLVAAGIAQSGRRLGSILALTASDHDLESGTVVWRADVAKGRNYGRGDETRPMTPLHRKAVRWVLEHHPNPKGPDAPLIWQTGGRSRAAKPENAVPQSTVWQQLVALEKLAGVEHKDGRAWHSFRRWTATRLADLLGDGKAAEFIGMTTDTLRKYGYKKVQDETMQDAADAMGGTWEEGGEE